MKLACLAILAAFSLMARDPLPQRIAHTDAAKARPGNNVHGGAGVLNIQTLLDRDAITGLNFMHAGPLNAKSSIGQHYHNNSEEMFLVLDADLEFSIDSRSSRLPGSVGVPCRLGHSHGLYNPTDKPVDWVNFNIRLGSAAPRPSPANWFSADSTGAFDLGDARVGVTLEPTPSFVHTGRLTKDKMRPMERMNGGKGSVLYRRTLGPSIFSTNWSFVDHIILPPGTSIGRHVHAGVEEVYYVIKGDGTVRVDEETAALRKGDAVPVKVKEVHSFENTGNADLELLVYGVALERGKLDITDVQ